MLRARICLISLVCLVALAATSAEARHSQQNNGTPFDYYLLTLSWSPAYCTTHPSDIKQCGDKGFGFVLHGLWPQYRAGGYPQNCSTEAQLTPEARSLGDSIFPNPNLTAHEWEKHGTCSGLDALAYFKAADDARNSIRIPEDFKRPKQGFSTTASEIASQFTASNSNLPEHSVVAACSGGELAEVRICMDRNLSPIACGSDVKTNCGTSVVHVTPPAGVALATTTTEAMTGTAPAPLLQSGVPVDWWFVFKFNAESFPGCGDGQGQTSCPFGGSPKTYASSQQYVYASNRSPKLAKGDGCLGDTLTDPVGATFNEVYNGSWNYVVWNDQFYNDPEIQGCTKNCSAPWGHSKGVLAWDDEGNGVVLQVSTPSWPASGSRQVPRKTDGNSLGCVDDDNIEVSQHFFALKLNKSDVMDVLIALANASVVTDTANTQITKTGGPVQIRGLVSQLGKETKDIEVTRLQLSSGVGLIAKPANLNVPPWQMVSAILGGVPLRAATWWENPEIPTTTDSTPVGCWADSLGRPGAVEIATSGQWDGTAFGLTGGLGPNFNHAKIGVSTAGTQHFTIFGDMNQQGSLSGPNCKSSQNGRGGLFFVIDDETLNSEVSHLIRGDTAPTANSE